MGFEKYGDVEKLDVLRGREAQILDEHSKRLGKHRISDFTEKQKEALLEDLNAFRAEEAKEEERLAEVDEDLERFEDEGGNPGPGKKRRR